MSLADAKAVFLSYASQDAEAARRICDSLRSGGIEVWFDQNELIGGDAWDAKIRKQIKECALFIPIISANTQARGEGYFRREWKLAAERTHDMADHIAFLLPVVLDATKDRAAHVPEAFFRVQWTRAPEGALPAGFTERVRSLLDGGIAQDPATPAPTAAGTKPSLPPKSRSKFWGWRALAVIVAAAGVTLAMWRPWKLQPSPSVPAVASAEERSSVASLGAKSIAVLPFTNVGTGGDNEFFSDGLHDDVITSLTKIRDVTVIAGGSVQAYRDPATRNVKRIAADLGVATVLEATVRRLGDKIHLNVKLIDARTNAHRWAEAFDGSTTDLFALQRTLAQEIASALKATLTSSERSLLDRRPTESQEAYDLFLRGHVLGQQLGPAAPRSAYEHTIELLEQAVAKDPRFALAHAHLSIKHGNMYWFGSVDPTAERRGRAERALAAAEQFAPDAPETHLARGAFAYQCRNDWTQALKYYALAEPGLPNDAELFYRIGVTYRRLGRWAEALGYFERSVSLNPHDLSAVSTLVDTQFYLRRYARTRDLAQRYLTMFPGDRRLREFAVRSQYALDRDRAAFVLAYATVPPKPIDPFALQIAYEKAMYAGDLEAADRVLSDPRLVVILPGHDVAVEPVALYRAQIAALQDKRPAAEKWADEAIAFFRRQTWSPRQEPSVQMGIALAEACANRPEAAVRAARAAHEHQTRTDALMSAMAGINLGRVYLLTGRRDDALNTLRSALSSGGDITAQEIRDDVLWSRLKDDPLFEEILAATKPL
jgi:TolB-like protein/Flp pilus assembly protein TadD